LVGIGLYLELLYCCILYWCDNIDYEH